MTNINALKADPYWENVVKSCETQNIDLNLVEAEIGRLSNEKYLSALPEGLPRLKQAAGIWLGRNSRDLVVKAEEYTVRVLSVEAPRTITKKDKKTKMRVSGITAFVQPSKAGAKMGLAKVAFFEENADKVAGVKEGSVYKVSLTGNYRDGSYQLAGDKRANFNNTVTLAAADPLMAPVADLITRLYPRIPCIDLKKYVGKLVQIHGNVVFKMVRPTKTGGTFGRYTIIDDSLTPADISAGRAISVMCSAEQVKYGAGSDIIIVGKVTNHPQYGLGLDAGINGMVIPVIVVPDDEVPEATTGTAVSVDFDGIDDEDEPSTPTGTVAATQPSADEFA